MIWQKPVPKADLKLVQKDPSVEAATEAAPDAEREPPAVEIIWRRPSGRRTDRASFLAQTYDDTVQA